MRNGAGMKKTSIVTTSWDDGHPLDLRLAHLLSSYGILGTFYVPLHHRLFPAIAAGQIRTLRTRGMEIGSHTLTHPNLAKLRKKQGLHELMESKRILENTLGEPVVSLCYPEGKFNPTVRSWVVEAGYQLARTTAAFRTDTKFDPFCMPVSFQLFPHPHTVHIRHALKEGNLRGMMDWYRFWRMESDLIKLSELILGHILEYGGILHIWGHSWEVEKLGLWGLLEEVLRLIANRRGVLYLTNSQVLHEIDESFGCS